MLNAETLTGGRSYYGFNCWIDMEAGIEYEIQIGFTNESDSKTTWNVAKAGRVTIQPGKQYTTVFGQSDEYVFIPETTGYYLLDSADSGSCTIYNSGWTEMTSYFYDIYKYAEDTGFGSSAYLEAGENGTDYTVEAYSCNPDELEVAVLDKPCFYAEKDTTLLPDETVVVSLVCALQQFQVSFEPSETFTSAFRSDETVDAQGGTKFRLEVSDANGNSVSYTMADLAKSAYFHTESPYIKLHVTGTTIKGFPVDYTETIEPKDGMLIAKDHLIIGLDAKATETKSFNLKATKIEL